MAVPYNLPIHPSLIINFSENRIIAKHVDLKCLLKFKSQNLILQYCVLKQQIRIQQNSPL